MLPLHHGDPGPTDDRTWLQQANDSEPGVFLAGTLHSVGALLFIAGIALYLYVAHSIRRSIAQGAVPSLGVLGYAHGFTLVGILLNGLGGLMRLWESDHPGLDRLGDSVWVQVLLVKHLFLVAGVGLAVWLTWRTRNLARAPMEQARLSRESPRMVGFALGSILTIFLATVLGVVAANVDLAADLGGPSAAERDPGDTMEGMTHPPAPLLPSRLDTSGVATGTPVRPGVFPHTFTVASASDRMSILLSWTSPAAVLTLEAVAPDGRTMQGNLTTSATSYNLTLEGALPVGDWVLRVRAERALNEVYELHARSGVRGHLIERTVTVLPNEQFFEANLLMTKAANLTYDWYVVDSTEAVHFNIHLHEGERVVYPVTGEWNRLNGTYVHATDNEGASLMWQNNATTPLRVHFTVWGDFRVDSYFPRAAPAHKP